MSDIDLFLKIDGIEGESQDSKHKGELQLLSFSKTVNHTLDPSAGSGADRGLSTWGDAAFAMWIDKAYPKLFQACVSGEHLKKAILTFRKAGKEQQEFLKVTFSDVLVSKCEVMGGASGKVVPTLKFSFNFAQIEEEYKTQKADGSLSGAIKYSYSIPKGPQQSQ